MKVGKWFWGGFGRNGREVDTKDSKSGVLIFIDIGFVFYCSEKESLKLVQADRQQLDFDS